MDLTGITSGYSDYLTTSANESASKVQKTANAVGQDATDEELMDACKQFESYLLEQVFKEMEKTTKWDPDEEDEEETPLTGAGNSLVDFFKDQTIATLASTSTEQSGLGIAQQLYEAMKRNG